MINQNILSMFKSHASNPAFSIIITDIQQNQDCGQENLKITVHQVDKSKEEIEQGANVVSRVLNIRSELGIDDEDLLITKLVGYSTNEQNIQTRPAETGLLSHFIEILETTLKKEVTIEFAKEYRAPPSILINIESKYESLYKTVSKDYISYDVEEYDTNGELIDKKTYYTGVNLTFNGLKGKQSYPLIDIIIIGDKEVKSVSTEVEKNIISDGEEFNITGIAYDNEGNRLVNEPITFYAEGSYWDINNFIIEGESDIISPLEGVKFSVTPINKRGEKVADTKLKIYTDKPQ